MNRNAWLDRKCLRLVGLNVSPVRWKLFLNLGNDEFLDVLIRLSDEIRHTCLCLHALLLAVRFTYNLFEFIKSVEIAIFTSQLPGMTL